MQTYIQPTLFDLSAFAKRKPSEQIDFERDNLELLLAFPDIVRRSFDRLNSEIFPIIELRSRDRNLGAVIISGFLRGELITNFPDYCYAATKLRFRLISKKHEWIYVKKLDENRRPMNIPTRNNEIIMNQRSFSTRDLESNIFLGYTASQDMTYPIDVYALCIDGEKEVWCSNLLDLAVKNIPIRTISTKKETQLKDGTIKIKKAKNL